MNHHPTTRLEIMKVPEEPMSDSKGCGRSFFKVLHEGNFKLNGELDARTHAEKLIEAITRRLP
ncbi:hypothetical protein Pint_06851 [Pistacia integerrima]|uniref:Uncharacterized protein n=1 Tax=Pistacia integerrima TaxID=434235 RepID=A0ACC0XSK3_9ROSI|nr:hypothetical protein Pint_06851 [Pistacia integerrima]